MKFTRIPETTFQKLQLNAGILVSEFTPATGTVDEADITKTDSSHKMLEGIVKDAVQNKVLGVPARISRNFDAFREVGNNSAHSITYTAGKPDIDNIARDYRVMMEDLYNRAGLM